MTSNYLFLSYSRDDREFMRRLRTRLEESGVRCWTDENLKPGTPDWQIAIEEALDGASALVAIWTPGAKDSRWMREELRYAAARDLPLVPVLAEGEIKDAVPFGFSGMQFIDLRGSENLRLNFRVLLSTVSEFLDESRSHPTLVQLASPRRRLPIKTVGLLITAIVLAALLLVVMLTSRGPRDNTDAAADVIDMALDDDQPVDLPAETTSPATAEPPGSISSNADWLPQSTFLNGVEMMLVPPGCFRMGSDSGRSDERPITDLCFGVPFWIDRYEVTNGAYGSVGLISGDQKPRESVNWSDAIAHCQARSARLPTEAEWEYAARGPDANDYPWGADFDGRFLNFCDVNCSESWADSNLDDGFRTTAFVGSYPDGASWVGAEDMAGNVWEWVNTIYRGYPYDSTDGRDVGPGADLVNPRVARGGSWVNVAESARSTLRLSVHPLNENPDLGFRCAADY